MKNADYPAMPVESEDVGVIHSGLTKREYFAAVAMPRIETLGNENDFAQTAKTVAQLSVALADALLAELERTQ